MNTYIYNQNMADICTGLASSYKKHSDGYLATFYANAARGFKDRSLEVTFAECEYEDKVWEDMNK